METKKRLTLKRNYTWLLILVAAILLALCVYTVKTMITKEPASQIDLTTDASQIGITMNIENADERGVTYTFISEPTDDAVGELSTGSWYAIMKYDGKKWVDVPYILDPDTVGWTSEAILIAPNETTTMEEEWDWLYGELEPGTYRFVKNVMNFKTTGDYDIYTVFADFEILSETENSEKKDAQLTAKIIEIDDATMLLASVGENASSDLFRVKTNMLFLPEESCTTNSELKVGMTVEINYSGSIMETYPASLDNPESYRIIELGDDRISMYMEALEEIYESDTALNDEISMMAFDFTMADSMTDSEKNAVAYLMASKYGMEGICATYDSLCEDGYIDQENMYFTNGILFELNVKEESDQKLTFSVSKWRSGLGAIGMEDCKASYDGESWNFENGAMWIS